MWTRLRKWVDENDKLVRFIVWVALGIWAIIATIVANWPKQTYLTYNQVRVPPTETRPLSAQCHQMTDFAQSYRIYVENNRDAPVYMTNAREDVLEGNRFGYDLTVMNGGGAFNPRRPDLDIKLELTCEPAHSAITEFLLWPINKLFSISRTH
jgi:hypothetical protein